MQCGDHMGCRKVMPPVTSFLSDPCLGAQGAFPDLPLLLEERGEGSSPLFGASPAP